jgi:hypothetical protein
MPFLPRGKSPRTHGIGGWVWTLWGTEKPLTPAGNRTPIPLPPSPLTQISSPSSRPGPLCLLFSYHWRSFLADKATAAQN